MCVHAVEQAINIRSSDAIGYYSRVKRCFMCNGVGEEASHVLSSLSDQVTSYFSTFRQPPLQHAAQLGLLQKSTQTRLRCGGAPPCPIFRYFLIRVRSNPRVPKRLGSGKNSFPPGYPPSPPNYDPLLSHCLQRNKTAVEGIAIAFLNCSASVREQSCHEYAILSSWKMDSL